MDSVNMLLTMTIAPKLGLDTTQSVIFTQAVSSITKSDIFRNVTGNLNYNISDVSGIYYVLFGLLLVGYLCYKYDSMKYFRRPTINNDVIVFNIYKSVESTEILTYMNNYCIDKNISLNIGTDKDLGKNVSQPIYLFDTPVAIEIVDGDKIVKGTIQTIYTNITVRETVSNGSSSSTGPTTSENKYNCFAPSLKIVLHENIISYKKLFSLIKSYNQTTADNSQLVTIYGSVVGLPTKQKQGTSTAAGGIMNHVTTILHMTKANHAASDFWREYFGDQKELVKKMIKLNQCNIILHGPPGTGKSKLIEAISKSTKRHIISLNLRILNKYDLIHILNSPEIGGSVYRTFDVIFVLEEFDISIDYLVQKEKIFNDNNSSFKPPKSDDESEESFTDTSSNGSSGTEKELFRFRFSPSAKDLIEKLDTKANVLCVGDLLEIFQSAIPRKGQMIIATTNHFNRIKKTLPALFRPGRLTPIEITYITQKVFDEMINYYYHVENTIMLPIDHTISTSHIVETINIYKDDYPSFCEIMNEIINKNNSIVYSDGGKTIKTK